MIPTDQYDFDKCVDFLTYFLGKSVEYAKGQGMSDYVSPDDNWTFHQEVSKCQNFVRSAMFEFYLDLLDASEQSLRLIREYSREEINWWQPEIVEVRDAVWI
jgi:hypothetical protein